MKKGLVILTVLAFIGGIAFADDMEPTMVKLTDPTVTFGATAYAGMYVLQNNTVYELKDGSADYEALAANLFGGLPTDSSYWSGYRYIAAPWVKLASGIFSAKFAPMFYGISGSEDKFTRLESTFAIAGTGFSLEDRIRYDNKATGGTSATNHRITAAVSMDNVSTNVIFDGTANNTNVLAMDDLFVPFRTMNLTDYQIKIKDLWGFADVKIGGLSTSYYHTNDYRYQAIDWFYDSKDKDNASSNVSGQSYGFRWVGTSTMIPVQTTYSVGKLIEAIPLTIRTGFKVPTTATESRAYFAGNNWIAAAEFAMEGIGKFNVGAIPGIAYTTTTEAAGVYTKATTNASTKVFVEANISAVEGLDLQAAFDYGTSTSASSDPAATTGTGVATSPFVTAKVAETMINFGLEAIYDLSSVLEGLEVDGAIAVASQTGKTDLNQTGTAYVAPTAATGTYIASNYSEAAKYGASPSFIFGVGVAYTIDDNNSVSFWDEFDSMAGDLTEVDTAVTSPTMSYGFYNTNSFGLGYTVKAGKGKIAAALGYTMYLGLPTAGDYGLTAVNDVAKYNQEVANAFKPLYVRLKYYATF